MNNNSKVLPNFTKVIALILFAIFSSVSFAEHHTVTEKKADKTLKSHEGVAVDDMDIEISPLSEEELRTKAEKEKRMGQMKEMVADDAESEIPE